MESPGIKFRSSRNLIQAMVFAQALQLKRAAFFSWPDSGPVCRSASINLSHEAVHKILTQFNRMTVLELHSTDFSRERGSHPRVIE